MMMKYVQLKRYIHWPHMHARLHYKQMHTDRLCISHLRYDKEFFFVCFSHQGEHRYYVQGSDLAMGSKMIEGNYTNPCNICYSIFYIEKRIACIERLLQN